MIMVEGVECRIKSGVKFIIAHPEIPTNKHILEYCLYCRIVTPIKAPFIEVIAERRDPDLEIWTISKATKDYNNIHKVWLTFK